MSGELGVFRLSGFDDPALPPERWDALLESAQGDLPFLTHAYQRAWWATFGRGTLLLVAAREAGRVVAVGSFFADGGMVFPVGSGGSDYLDFIGGGGRADVLEALLDRVRELAPDFCGLRLYHLPSSSRTTARLAGVARRLGLELVDEGAQPAPALDLVADPVRARAATEKRTLVRRERALRRDGALHVVHSRDGRQIAPQLEAFFEQHVERWSGTPHPSLFLEPVQRDFYRALTREAADAGWLRFTRLEWQGRPVAFHYGFSLGGRYLWYKPTFDPALKRHSPGQVLLRHLLLAALDEGARTFDFGLGDEAFKARFATRVDEVRTWGLYPTAHGGQL